MAIDPSTLEYQYRRVAGGENNNQKATYGVEFSSGGSNYTFIPSSVINKGVSAGDTNYVLPWFLKEDNLKELGKNAQFVDLKGNSWYGDYLKDTVGASTEGFLVPAGSLSFDSVVKPTTAAIQGLGNTSEGLSYILDKQGSDGKYIASDGRITTLTAGKSILGKVFGGLGDSLAGVINGGFETLGGLPPIVTAAISAYNPVLGAAITGAKIGGAVGSGQADLGDAAKSIAAAYAGSQLGGEVGGATGSNVAGQFAGNTASGLLSGQDLGSSLTNAAINTGANAAANGLLSPAPEPYTPPKDYSTGANYDLTQGQDVGGLGLQGQVGAFDPSNPYSFNTNFGNSDSMGGGTGIQIPQGEGATLGSIGAAAETPTDNPNLVSPAGTGLLSGLLKSLFTGSSSGSTGTGNMATTQDNNAALSNLFGGLLRGSGSLMQGSTNTTALQQQADALRAAGQQAAQSSQFRPVGTTTTFGTSNFQVDPTTGQLTSAGYNLSPQLQAYQDQIMGSNRQSLTDAANLQNLGRQYIGQDPNQVASNWYNQQQALLNPSRDVESARLANQLQQTGRTGVSVAQGGSLGMANPEQQALANARAMADAQMAANAQTYGQNQVKFGQGLLTGAYDPFNAGLKTASTVEGLGQQPLGLSTDLASQFQKANAQGGALNLKAQTSAADALLEKNQYNPYADVLRGGANNQQLTGALGSLFGQTDIGQSIGGLLSGLNPSFNDITGWSNKGNGVVTLNDGTSINLADYFKIPTFNSGGYEDLNF